MATSTAAGAAHPVATIHPSVAIQPKATLLPHIKYWAPEGLNKPIAPIALQEVIQIAYRIAREHEIVPVEVYLRGPQAHKSQPASRAPDFGQTGNHINISYKTGPQVASHLHTTCHAYVNGNAGALQLTGVFFLGEEKDSVKGWPQAPTEVPVNGELHLIVETVSKTITKLPR